MLLFAKYLMCFTVLFCAFVPALPQTRIRTRTRTSNHVSLRSGVFFSVGASVCISINHSLISKWIPPAPLYILASEREKKRKQFSNFHRLRSCCFSLSIFSRLSIFKTQKSFSILFCLAAIVVLRLSLFVHLLLLSWLWFAMLFARRSALLYSL